MGNTVDGESLKCYKLLQLSKYPNYVFSGRGWVRRSGKKVTSYVKSIGKNVKNSYIGEGGIEK